jgi:hypothetical protein
MQIKYFIQSNNGQLGPLTIDELRAKNIIPVTLVWRQGMQGWTEAGNVPELASLFPPIPPPFQNTPPPYTVNASSTNISAQGQNKKSKMWLWILSGIGIILVVFFGLGAYSEYKRKQIEDFSLGTQGYDEKVMTVEEIERANPTQFLEAGGQYRSNILDTRFVLTGFVKNNATVANYKDPIIEVVFYSSTDTELKRENYTLYKRIPAHGKVGFEWRIDKPNAASKCGWSVVGATAE